MNKDIEQFNEYFNNNYDHFKDYCERYDYPIDLLHHAYEMMVKKIEKTGFENNHYATYIIRTICNTHINNKKHSYNKKTDFIPDKKHFEVVDDNDDIEEVKYMKNQYIVSKLFKYIQNHLQCTEEEIMVWKLYYLSSEKMTYKKVNEITGINKNRITKILRKIKKELNNNFKQYLEDDKGRD